MNVEKPLVSIVLPTYNGERYLSESIQSCLDQTYANFELIIVDDGSTDQTAEIIKFFACEDARIQVIHNPKNIKLPGSLNIGFRAAKGKYLTWTSDDNAYRPEAIEVMVRELELSPNIGLVYTGVDFIDENGNFIRHCPSEPSERINERCVVAACFLYRMEVQETVGFYNESLFMSEDYDYWLRVAKQYQMKPIEQILYRYRLHANSLTGMDNIPNRARAFDRLHTIHNGPDPRRYKQQLWKMYISHAFELYYQGIKNFKLLRSILFAAAIHPKILLNKGVWSIGIRTIYSMIITRLSK